MGQRWILRRGSPKSGFHYIDQLGRRVTAARQVERIESLVIPPAWKDVHIATTATSSVQAWGYDVRGRKQYRYNERAVATRELRKYHRVRELARTMPRIRKIVRADARQRVLTRDAVAALVLRLIGETFCRVGGERYAKENGTFGITTLRKKHLELGKETVSFVYKGKSNVRQRQVATSEDIVRLMARLRRTPGTRLFRYKAAGGWRNLNAADVNDYLQRRVGPFKAKDFRTWGGTLRAATVLAELGPAKSPTEAKRNVALAMRLVASELGNTPTVCRSSYVHPMVIARYLDAGETIVLPRRQKSLSSAERHSVEERALIAFLERHFPERRLTSSPKRRLPDRRLAA
ncbi:MAG: DNA topoisomerase IB [Gemmatimonadaceae bacterium]